jgi:hypothetical protein
VEGIGEGLHGERFGWLRFAEAGEVGGDDAIFVGEVGQLGFPDAIVERKAVDEDEGQAAAALGVRNGLTIDVYFWHEVSRVECNTITIGEWIRNEGKWPCMVRGLV